MEREHRFTYGDTVYLKTDPDQYERLVTAVILRSTHVEYEVSFLSHRDTFEEIELSGECDEVKRFKS